MGEHCVARQYRETVTKQQPPPPKRTRQGRSMTSQAANTDGRKRVESHREAEDGESETAAAAAVVVVVVVIVPAS